MAGPVGWVGLVSAGRAWPKEANCTDRSAGISTVFSRSCENSAQRRSAHSFA